MSQEVDSDLVSQTVILLEENGGLGELEYATNDWEDTRHTTSTPAPPPIPKLTNTDLLSSESDMKAEEVIPKYQDDQILTKSPMVGTAYLTPDPSSPPFVNIGDAVKQGDTVIIIEAMKVMNPISAHKSGIVKEICRASEPVEFNQWLW